LPAFGLATVAGIALETANFTCAVGIGDDFDFCTIMVQRRVVSFAFAKYVTELRWQRRIAESESHDAAVKFTESRPVIVSNRQRFEPLGVNAKFEFAGIAVQLDGTSFPPPAPGAGSKP
jgi:hypothetical protein